MKREGKLSLHDVCHIFGKDIKDTRERFIEGLCTTIVENTKDGVIPLDFWQKNGNHPLLSYYIVEGHTKVRLYFDKINAKERKVYYHCEEDGVYDTAMRSCSIDVLPTSELYYISEFVLSYIDNDLDNFFDTLMSEENVEKLINSFTIIGE